MANKRKVWFEYSWLPGILLFPCSTEGWLVFLGAWGAGGGLVAAMTPLQAQMPSAPVVPVIEALLLLLAIGYALLAFTHMAPRGRRRDEETNQEARRLFGDKKRPYRDLRWPGAKDSPP